MGALVALVMKGGAEWCWLQLLPPYYRSATPFITSTINAAMLHQS
jgi:hypothetical protein